jgi:hypothetical protein
VVGIGWVGGGLSREGLVGEGREWEWRIVIGCCSVGGGVVWQKGIDCFPFYSPNIYTLNHLYKYNIHLVIHYIIIYGYG